MRNQLVLLTCVILLALLHSSVALWRRRIRLPTKPLTTTAPTTVSNFVAAAPVAKHSSGLPYCSPTVDVNSVLNPKSIGRKKRSTMSWPFECAYPSVVKYQNKHQFIQPLYECCQKCDFPDFLQCTQATPSPQWLCPSNGIHCIYTCIKKHDPNQLSISGGGGTGTSSIGGGIGGGITTGGIKFPKYECTKTVTVNGVKCVRQLCIPLTLN